MLSDGGEGELAGGGNGRPKMFYLYSSGDADHCCAKAIERGIFRTASFVKRTRSAFECYKVDRDDAIGRELIERFEINDRPALLFTDHEDGELGRLDDHFADPKQFSVVLERAIAFAMAKAKASGKVEKDLPRAATHLERGNVTMALRLLRGADKLRERLHKSTAAKLDVALVELSARGDAEVEAALALVGTDPAAAHADLRKIGDTYRGLDASDRADGEATRLEADPEAGPAIEAAKKERRRRG